ncbi:MAG: hypothetical protein HY013_10815 [Candidatus Solibacter usitatus]|nr:hypothetical protein [Candidatus Solibacter usitatus]
MVCPKCQREGSPQGAGACPFCGFRSDAGVMKTSAVRIAAGETDAVFHSVDEVPEPWRERLLESTRGANAGTILIADHRLIQTLPGRGAPRWLLRAAAVALFTGAAALIWYAFR